MIHLPMRREAQRRTPPEPPLQIKDKLLQARRSRVFIVKQSDDLDQALRTGGQ